MTMRKTIHTWMYWFVKHDPMIATFMSPNRPHIVICLDQPECPCRDVSCFARTYGKTPETYLKKKVFRNDSPECATDTSGNDY